MKPRKSSKRTVLPNASVYCVDFVGNDAADMEVVPQANAFELDKASVWIVKRYYS